jgi:high-affinity K+ transport system ATPase subunit B
MVTGDAEPVARAVAADIGIDTVFAKCSRIKSRRKCLKCSSVVSALRWLATVSTMRRHL